MTVESSFGPAPLPTYSEPEAVILASPAPASGNGDIKAFDDKDGPSFSDLLDILNPLQHIPVINTLYQQLTGDKEGAVADLVGGALWGGVIGLGAAVANLVIEDSTGKSIGDNVVALFSGDDSNTAVAKDDRPADQTASAETSGRVDTPPVVAAPPVTLSGLGEASDASSAGEAMPGGGPIIVGNFLVFGGLSASTKASASVLADAGDTLTDNGAARATRTGDFLVFGAGQPATNDLPVSAPAAANAPLSLTPTSGGTDKAAATATAPSAASSAPPARSFPIPTQRNAVTPPQVLPMPTTGPAAVPGNTRAISGARGSADQTGSAWFAGAFNQAMDKYNRAAGLGNGTTAAAQGTTDNATANSVLQMN